MRGMILKDLYTIFQQLRKLLFLVPLLMTAVVIAEVLIQSEVLTFTNWLTIAGIFTYAVLAETFSYDKRSEYLKWALTTPVRRRDYLHSKYILAVISSAGCAAVTLVTYLLCVLLTDGCSAAMIGQLMQECLLLFLIVAFGISCMIPLTIRFDTAWGTFLFFLLFAGFAFFCGAVRGFQDAAMEDGAPLPAWSNTIIPAMLLLICVILYASGRKWIMRKEV